MQTIQIGRGHLGAREAHQSLAFGELFLNTVGSKDLWVGTGAGEKIRIGGETSLVYKGSWTQAGGTATTQPTQELIVGNVYYVDVDVELLETTPNYPEFRVGDFVLYTGLEPAFIKIGGGGGGTAEHIEFNAEFTNYADDNVENVQEALVYADRQKLSYGGDLAVTPMEVGPDDPPFTGYSKLAIFRDSGAKAGFFYSITESVTIDGVSYEEGDFLVVTSDVKTNDEALTADAVTFQKMTGGTHDASKLYVNAEYFVRLGDGASPHYEETDQAVTNVQDALVTLFGTKSDLDPTTGKVLLSQIPDTLIGTMEYHGVLTAMRAPTAADKSDFEDAETEDNEITTLTKGDYWVYSGDEWNADTEDADISGITLPPNGTINNGDWIIYNGETFDVLTNTSPFIGINVSSDPDGTTDDVDLDQRRIDLDGKVNFESTKRGELLEVATTGDEATNTIAFSAPDSALLDDIENTVEGTIYKESGDGILTKSIIKDVSTDTEGKVVIGDGEAPSSVELDKTDLVFTDTTDDVTSTTTIRQNEEIVGTDTELDIQLPNKSGVLATTGDIGLEDGKENFITMFGKDTDGNAVFKESALSLIDKGIGTEDAPTNAAGFIFHRTAVDQTQIFFRKKDTVQVMPLNSGILLNTNSIIDGGEWVAGATKPKYSNEVPLIDAFVPSGFDNVSSYEDYLASLAGSEVSSEFLDTITCKVDTLAETISALQPGSYNLVITDSDLTDYGPSDEAGSVGYILKNSTPAGVFFYMINTIIQSN